jgi:hypothetical protein
MQPVQVTPWYKQFWPWFLIAVPLSSFIVGFTVLHLAINTSDSLVVDDYYKQGRSINARLDKIENAKKLNILPAITITPDGNLSVRFISGQPRSNKALKLTFYHVTLKNRDMEILLSSDASGVYRGFTQHPLAGKWRMTLMPIDETWKMQQLVLLPQQDEIRFTP